MSRTGENIYRRKDGRWEGRHIKSHTPSGKAVYTYAYGKTYHEVKEKLSCLRREESLIFTGQKDAEEDNSGILFGEVAAEWLSTVQPELKVSTYNKYDNMLRLYLLPAFGDKSLSVLSYTQIEKFQKELLLSGGVKKNGLSPKTVTDIIALLRNVLRFAANRGNTVCCDATDITVRQNIKKMRVLSEGEQVRIVTYLLSDLTPPNAGVLVCLFTGLRIGEICALKWADISLQEKTLSVRRTMQRVQMKGKGEKKTKILISAPKSECSFRIIPLPDNLIVALSGIKCSAEAYFLTGKTKEFLEPRGMQNHFKRVLKTCHIENANFHALRHTFATRCVEVGFDIKSLSEILGHANVNITMNRYVHPSLGTKRSNMQRLTNLFAVR